MSTPVNSTVSSPDLRDGRSAATRQGQQAQSQSTKNYKGFVAGVASGIVKLSVGHPFDTIKVRLQTTNHAQFNGPIDCLLQTLRKEGIKGLYKGATPPLVGWMAMDSIMLGSLTFYRRTLLERVFPTRSTLPTFGHGLAGLLAGHTVSLLASPVELVKSRLQTQYHSSSKSQRLYTGPIDCTRKLLHHHGLRRGLYHGLCASLIFRSFFFVWWSSYDVLTRLLTAKTALSTPLVNFWAGGLSAQVFWLTAYPSDVVKQRIMTDPLGGGLGDGERRFRRWRDAAVAVGRERGGLRGYWRGFVPCFLRAFPANGAALVAFEAAMRAMG